MEKQLENKNIITLIILVFITYGIYIPIWFLNYYKDLNNLTSKLKINRSLIIFLLIIYSFSASYLIISLFVGEIDIINLIDSLINLIGIIVTLILSFRVKDILNEYYGINVSGVFTFLITIFHLQYKINQIEKSNDKIKKSTLNFK